MVYTEHAPTLLPHGPQAREGSSHPSLDTFFLKHPRNEDERLSYWAKAAERLDWETTWHSVHTHSSNPTRLSWFDGGHLNVAHNCVDRHVQAGKGNEIALHFEGEPGDRQDVTYSDLRSRVCRAANALEALGVAPGDRVIIHLPVLVQTIVATLACARIGAVHALVFGGFSAEALRFRIEDTGAKVLITSDGQYRRGTPTPVKPLADEALSGKNRVEQVLVVRRTAQDVPMIPGRDRYWDEFVERQNSDHEALSFPAEHPLFIMYTSGTTGRPKGLVHTSGGYLTQASLSFEQLFAHEGRRVHWCTADLAWITAHTYEIYGPLSNACTQVIYEGTPDTPHPGRHAEIIERYGVTSYYTAPTLIRSLRAHFPDGLPVHYSLNSLKILGSVGEPIDPDTHAWFRKSFGPLPHVDTWWQSETGATVCSPLPFERGIPGGSVGGALPGSDVLVVDDDGAPVPDGTSGNLVLTSFPPAIARTVWGDPQRYERSYFEAFSRQGFFASGDTARVDGQGHLWVSGRCDDVLNVSGHRLSSIEIESAALTHPEVTEAAVCPVPDEVSGQAVAVFVVGQGLEDARDGERILAEVRASVAQKIGPVAKPKHVLVVPEVPRTRSGKIMRRLLTQLYVGAHLGDTSSLANDSAIEAVRSCLTSRQSSPSHL